MRVRVYIAGPMTGYENFNREAFHKAEEELKREGHTVLNPAMLPDGLTQPHYMDICMAMIRCVDAIYMLQGWQRSAVSGQQALRRNWRWRRSWGMQLFSRRRYSEYRRNNDDWYGPQYGAGASWLVLRHVLLMAVAVTDVTEKME